MLTAGHTIASEWWVKPIRQALRNMGARIADFANEPETYLKRFTSG